ncbi:copper resistance CopC family protein [Knoellia subterranea]|nr:copper resistance CopC family protein [Knoellia subterranea]
MRKTTRGLIVLLLTAFVAMVGGVVPASAHSRLISISPKDGAALPSSPTEVVLTFNETVKPQFVTVRVTDSEGGEVVDGEATAEGATVTLPVAQPIAAGTYNIVYRVVSADSHPISGKTTFTVEGNPQAPATSTSPSASGSVAPTPSATAGDATPSADSSPTTATTAAGEGTDTGGESTPTWVWFIVFAAVVGAIAATFYAVRRDNGEG